MGYLKSNAEVKPKKRLLVKINEKIYDSFKELCRVNSIQISTLVECFCRQFANGEFEIEVTEIKEPIADVVCYVNQEVFDAFKIACKQRKITMKSAVQAFMADYSTGDYEVYLRNVEE